jgi:hypothetical protein
MKLKPSITLLALALVGCGETQPPKTIEEINSGIVSVNEVTESNKKLLRISLKPFDYNEYSTFFDGTQRSVEILGGIVKYFPDRQVDQIQFVYIAALVDRYGNSSAVPVISLNFDMEDVKKINFKDDHFTGWGLLKLVDSMKYMAPAGREIVKNYCQDESSIKYAANFCRTAISS